MGVARLVPAGDRHSQPPALNGHLDVVIASDSMCKVKCSFLPEPGTPSHLPSAVNSSTGFSFLLPTRLKSLVCDIPGLLSLLLPWHTVPACSLDHSQTLTGLPTPAPIQRTCRNQVNLPEILPGPSHHPAHVFPESSPCTQNQIQTLHLALATALAL